MLDDSLPEFLLNFWQNKQEEEEQEQEVNQRLMTFPLETSLTPPRLL